MKVKKFEKALDPGYPSRRQLAEYRVLLGIAALGLGTTVLADPLFELKGDLDCCYGDIESVPPLPERLRPPPILMLEPSQFKFGLSPASQDKPLTRLPVPDSFNAPCLTGGHGLSGDTVDEKALAIMSAALWEAWSQSGLLTMETLVAPLDLDIANYEIAGPGPLRFKSHHQLKSLPSLAEIRKAPRTGMSGRLPGITAAEPRNLPAEDLPGAADMVMGLGPDSGVERLPASQVSEPGRGQASLRLNYFRKAPASSLAGLSFLPETPNPFSNGMSCRLPGLTMIEPRESPSYNEVVGGSPIVEETPSGVQLPPIPSTDPSTAPSEKDVCGHTGPGYGWVESGNGPAFLTTNLPLPLEIKINSAQETPASPLAGLPPLEEIVDPPQVSAADMTM